MSLPDPAETALTVIGVKASLLVSGAGGAIIALLANQGGFRENAISGIVGFLSAIFLTDGILEFSSRFFFVSPAGERTVSFVFGIVGFHIMKALLAIAIRFRERSPQIADEFMEEKLGIEKPKPRSEANEASY